MTRSTMDQSLDQSLYLGGRWHPASGTPIEVFNPTTGKVVAAVASATDEEVEAALSAAREAQLHWRAMPAAVRGDFLRTLADIVEAHRGELIDLLVTEVGKPLAQADAELAFAEGFLRYNSEWDRRLEGDILPGDVPGETINLLREPVGVVAAICPWNFPLAVLCRKIAPALVTGNTVVVKPSEVSPLATLRLFELIDEKLQLPAGVLNLVCGAATTGQALVDSALTSLISFTGHMETGKQIMANAARNLTRVSLELGGKAPAIVWEDADLDLAIPAIVEARHANSGQVCTSAERVLVHRDLMDTFTERYVEAVQSLTLGDPKGQVDVGPLASSVQLEKTRAAVSLAVGQGAKVLTGGDRPTGSGFARGYWYAPTVLAEVTSSMSVMHDETFGPVTPIIGIDSLDQAVAIANDSRYGLSAYLFSRDYSTVLRTVNDLQFGEIYVNRSLGESVHAHHAGFKESGLGGEDGKWGLLRYTQIKTVYHHYGL